MTWLVWRQYRALVLSLLGLIGALAAASGVCAVALRRHRAASPGAGDPQWGHREWDLLGLAGSAPGWITVAALGLLVVLATGVGPQVFAHELETRRHTLAFTQDRPRWQWYLARVVLVVVPLSLAMGVLGFALAATRDPVQALVEGRFTGQVYLTSGPLTAAAAFALMMLAAACSLVTRRSSAAVALSLVAIVFALLVAAPARDALGPEPVVVASPLEESLEGWPVSAEGGPTRHYYPKMVGSAYVDAAGRPVAQESVDACQQGLVPTGDGPLPTETLAEYQVREDAGLAAMKQRFAACLRAAGAVRHEVRHRPDSQFWPMQLTDTGLALAFGLLLVPAGAAALRRV